MESKPRFTSFPSSSAASDTPLTPAQARYEQIYADEWALQSKLHPSSEDVPGCYDLFRERMKCMASSTSQRKEYYLSGNVKTCQQQQAEWDLCFDVLRKAQTEPLRREAWIKHKTEMWTKRRVDCSSEDVWKMREKPLEGFPPIMGQEALQEFGVAISSVQSSGSVQGLP